MAAVVDNRYAGHNAGMNMVSAPAVLVSDEYGGWMTRAKRFIVFGIIGMAITLGLFLPGIIMTASNWDDGIRGACGDNVVERALTVCCFFIFHSLLVVPMFIRGDRAHSVVNNVNGMASFWRNRLAHTATVLQVVGNLIEIALLIWTANAFWGDNNSGQGACETRYPQFQNYMWAMLIGGFFFSTLSLITIKQQYTSAALRDSLPSKSAVTMNAP
jgi:hypothetical protein